LLTIAVPYCRYVHDYVCDLPVQSRCSTELSRLKTYSPEWPDWFVYIADISEAWKRAIMFICVDIFLSIINNWR
jgi:hypothetical protein